MRARRVTLAPVSTCPLPPRNPVCDAPTRRCDPINCSPVCLLGCSEAGGGPETCTGPAGGRCEAGWNALPGEGCECGCMPSPFPPPPAV